MVLDNLKEAVLKPDLYEPQLNPVYAATLTHCGVVADPARVRAPNRKGTVEHAIGHTQATALKDRRFESIEAQNMASGRLLLTHTKADRPGTLVLPQQERVFNPSRETRQILRQAEQRRCPAFS